VPEEAEPVPPLVPPLVRAPVPVPERLQLVRAPRMVLAWRPVRVLRLVRGLVRVQRQPGPQPSPVR
jgi:hypothetical protein